MAEERLQPIALHQEMQRSYLEYAMSVIVGRALPDARDGLKPVQRRILFAMHELGLTPDRPYRKCARVVGDVLGKYHPHGDQAVYDALVRLVQNFSSRFPVLDGHGNFGSVDDDPPAAMRYTETRLASIAHMALLDEIGEETVDFTANFDGSQQEPSVLPAQLPFLLLNGCSGIAVGMATSIPPHNLGEVVDGLIALIRKPDLSDDKLLGLIPGPDFPTGGEILLGTGIHETYLKGRGSIPMRGVAHVEEIQPGKGRHRRSAVVVTELPYQLSKAGWIEKLADLVNNGKIGGIADIRDESDREGMRIVVELRRDANPENVLGDLHRRTSLQSNFGAILLALVNGQPQQLSLRKLLQTFLEYRELTVIRRTNHALGKTKARLEVVEGLITALNALQAVIAMIQEAADAAAARARLMVQLDLNEKQADAVLAMPLRRLTSLEQSSLRQEAKELQGKQEQLQFLLENRESMLEVLIQELRQLKKRFNNPRRTRLVEGGDDLVAERAANQRPNAEVQRQQALSALPSDGRILIQQDSQVKVMSPQILGRLHLNEACKLSDGPSPARLILPIEPAPRLLAVTNNGRVALVRWEFAGQQPGSLQRFLPGGLEKETLINIFPLPVDQNLSLGLLSSDGRFKRLPLEEVMELSGRAATIVKLKDGVVLKSALICQANDDIILASNIGRVIRINVNNDSMPLMGKLAQGPMTMRLLPEEMIVGAVSCPPNCESTVLLATRLGKFAKILVSSIRVCQRGDLGEIGLTIKDSSQDQDQDRVVDICNGNRLVGLVSSQGRHARIEAGKLELTIPIKPSLNIVELKDNEEIQKLVPLITTNNILD
ncbi:MULTISPECIES: DNA gyrase/topoisomerase IV subunit A [Prochlorococcus]|uniref:DNA gyrase/topoisomerase IV subunit A n=1 Tax=Prochlorococcus TaxID=1218 RepID=UPI0007B3DE3F|nr:MULTISPECIES: DNA topoisomerase (ATP-hydrolyzing) [Prochlorococcus]KZR79388.1 DNA gyrase subunit A [Prochlorococcus marinus str. MIT 1327]NMP07308.1 DNA topoisomerase 4 subunit A [Prochlorococcus sp. P1361]